MATLVTGATGFIGAHLTRLLVGRGDEVRVTVRSGSRFDALEGLDVKPVQADVLDRRAMRRAMRNVDRLFHVAGMAQLDAPRARIFGVNVEGVQIVLEEALRAGVQRVVYTSSVAAIGPAPPGQTADETSAWEAGGLRIPYLDAKHEAETVALRLVARGLPLVIVNPAHVFGPGLGRGSNLATGLVRRFMRRQIPAYVDGTLNVVGVQDVARGLVLADERGAVGERYILGNRNFTMTRLFADLGRLSGIEPPAVKLPLPVALAIAETGQRLGQHGLPSPVEVRLASMNWAFANRKARRELAWRPSPHEDCLEETIEYCRELYGDRVPAAGARQPFVLRATGDMLRRLPI
jgi:dihydroflavonol-4-reductase